MHTVDHLEGHAPVDTFPERRANLQTISTQQQLHVVGSFNQQEGSWFSQTGKTFSN